MERKEGNLHSFKGQPARYVRYWSSKSDKNIGVHMVEMDIWGPREPVSIDSKQCQTLTHKGSCPAHLGGAKGCPRADGTCGFNVYAHRKSDKGTCTEACAAQGLRCHSGIEGTNNCRCSYMDKVLQTFGCGQELSSVPQKKSKAYYYCKCWGPKLKSFNQICKRGTLTRITGGNSDKLSSWASKHAGYAPHNAFDGKLSTFWENQNGGAHPDYLVYDFGTERQISAYSIQGFQKYCHDAPKSWSLEGSHDSKTSWTVLDRQTGVKQDCTRATEVVLRPASRFRFVRVAVTEAGASGSAHKGKPVSIAELRICGQ